MFNRVGKTAHSSLVMVLIVLMRHHEKDPTFPALLGDTIDRTFDKAQQWDRMQVDLSSGQTLVALFADKRLTATLDMQDIPASGKRLKPEDILHAVIASRTVL